MISQLLQQTARRYEAAVRSVLAAWSPECGCDRPGSRLHCEACPSLSVFEHLVEEEIRRLSDSESGLPTATKTVETTDETTCIYIP